MTKLNLEKIHQNLILPLNVLVLDEVDSTNTLAKTDPSILFDSVIATTYQTKGRGRYDRVFYSPKDAGLYFSLVIQPKMCDLELMTLRMAVAVSLSLEALGLCPSIKWLNDIYLNQRKLCGILCEGVFQNQQVQKLIIGVGINIEQSIVPKELASKMISLEEVGVVDVDYNWLLTQIINQFYQLHNDSKIIDAYRLRCHTIGQRVSINGLTGHAVSINESGYLVLELDNHDLKVIRTGEIV